MSLSEIQGRLPYSYFKTTWNWVKCRNCKGTGLTRNWDKMGRYIDDDLCPTCGGKGGWPKYAQPDVNARLKRERANLDLTMRRF